MIYIVIFSIFAFLVIFFSVYVSSRNDKEKELEKQKQESELLRPSGVIIGLSSASSTMGIPISVRIQHQGQIHFLW